jgi:hypothetical protein
VPKAMHMLSYTFLAAARLSNVFCILQGRWLLLLQLCVYAPR